MTERKWARPAPGSCQSSHAGAFVVLPSSQGVEARVASGDRRLLLRPRPRSQAGGSGSRTELRRPGAEALGCQAEGPSCQVSVHAAGHRGCYGPGRGQYGTDAHVGPVLKHSAAPSPLRTQSMQGTQVSVSEAFVPAFLTMAAAALGIGSQRLSQRAVPARLVTSARSHRLPSRRPSCSAALGAADQAVRASSAPAAALCEARCCLTLMHSSHKPCL